MLLASSTPFACKPAKTTLIGKWCESGNIANNLSVIFPEKQNLEVDLSVTTFAHVQEVFFINVLDQ